MDKFRNGALVGELPKNLAWRKATASGPNGACVELAPLPDSDDIAMRNSRFADGAALVYTKDEIAALIDGAKNGEFDDLVA
jgi:hypothetical protein